MELNKIHNGDCFDYLKNLPDQSVDLIVSSPPYNIGKEYEKKTALQVYLEAQTRLLTECKRVLKDTGSIFWQVGSYSNPKNGSLTPLDVKFFPILEDLDMIPRNRIVWIRTHGLHGQKKFSARHETILWFSKTNTYKFYLEEIRVPQKYQNKKHYSGNRKGELSCNPDGKNPGDVWAFRNVKHNHEEQTIHPCQFPEDLIERIVMASTDQGDVVLDPYMGTGTVAVVAKRLGRNYLGAELDPTYYEVGQRRILCKPDKDGVFPNLKTLREYTKRTGENIQAFRFEMQKGKYATDSSKSKIYPEEHHLEEVIERLTFEEETFHATLNGLEAPKDKLLHNLKIQENGSPSLFS